MGLFRKKSREQNAVRSYDEKLKIVVLGDSSVGKSSLIRQYVKNEFTGQERETIDAQIHKKNIQVQGKIVNLSMWDTAGQERYSNAVSVYYRGANGAILVYDVTNRPSFDNVKSWIDKLECYCVDYKLVLVGNKEDDEENRQISTQEAAEFAEERGFRLFETSAKENTNIDNMIETLATLIVEDRHRKTMEKEEEAIRLSEAAQSSKRSGKCC